MTEFKISLDTQKYNAKPTNDEIGKISSRIGRNVVTISDSSSIHSLVRNVGQSGQTFSPATFCNGSRKIDNFHQMQLFVLDFDGGISYEDVIRRTEQYDLPVLFSYDTFSSENHSRFRIVFLNDVPITDKKAAKIYKDALTTILPEADKHDQDIAKMYYGGKELLYFDKSIPTLDIESVLRNMSYYLQCKYGATHYKHHIKKFASKHGIRLNKKGLLDISVVKNDTEIAGTHENGKNSPKSILLLLKANGEILPKSYYRINLDDGCTSCSVQEKYYANHAEYRAGMLKDITNRCRLFRDFKSCERRLHHEELFGISTTIIHVESGIEAFKEILSSDTHYYDSLKQDKWNFYLKYNKAQNYKPMDCNMFCPYKDKCKHGRNILSTVKPKRRTMERLANFAEEYHSIEDVQADLESKFEQAISADDQRFHVIKAQTAIGKSYIYLQEMKNTNKRFLIAAPTNKLKQDLYKRALENGIEVAVTPSLNEIETEMPTDVWSHIKHLRDTGQHPKVHSFITKVAEEENIKCLKKYLKKQNEFEKHSGHTITTHRRLLNMSKETLSKYDVVIIDEDIILGSIALNQCEIPVSLLRKIMENILKEREKYVSTPPSYRLLLKKIKKILEVIETNKLFKLFGFEWGDEEDNEDTKNEADGISALTDIPSLCMAEHFIYRKHSEEKKFKEDSKEDIKEDSIVFLKPYKFKNIKYIMLSATVDKDICEYCFGKQNVKFYECKQAPYKGKLNQYYDQSMSRACLRKDENIRILQKIPAWSGFQHMITFQGYHKDDMYFGNAIGCDHLKGQNIDVVGTPYHVDFLYKLLPFTMGLQVNGDTIMKSCLVTHNGYRFYFTTYEEEHEELRKFHFWMIESDLEQAVGRARLLRENCTVNLFSNFPLRQAVMKVSEYDNIDMT